MRILGPTTFYHRTFPPRTVKDAVEYARLGEGWADTPAAFYAGAEPPEEAPEPEPDAPSIPTPVEDEPAEPETTDAPPVTTPRPRRGRPRKAR